MERKPLTFATGSRASGKTKMMELLCRLAHDKSVMCYIDTSDIIRNHIRMGTDIGQSFSAYKSHMSAGRVVPAHDLIVEAIFMEARRLWSECHTHQVLISGTPRHIEQTIKLKNSGHPIRVFHIIQEKEDVSKGVHKRQQENGAERFDESSDAIETAWTEYQELIIPGLRPLNGDVLDLKRSDPMRTRLQRAIGHMILPDHVRTKMLRRLGTRDHPVSLEVDILDGTVRS